MELQKQNILLNTEPAQASWNSFYRVAGIGTLIAVGFVVLDIALSFAGGDMGVGGLTAQDWFAQIQNNWFLALRNLGMFNVINTTLMLPLYISLYRAYRGGSPAAAVLALVLYSMGTAIYASNNESLTMLSLSSRYASAAGEAEKALLAAAGTAVLAQAEDFTPGTFFGFFFSGVASLLMMVVLLRGRVFARAAAWMGLVGSACMLVFTIGATFLTQFYDIAMLFALVGGLLMIAWNLFAALAMFRLSRMDARNHASASAVAVTGIQ